jgi:16S rRNA (guanine966-N2)-methyltransferase
MVMRVISGKAKGRKLKLVPGETTRPMMDRVKENLFNLLGHEVVGTRWLDLFAGTGQVGIEALSRGASRVVFLDTARPAIRTIYDNLKHTELENGAEVLLVDAFRYLGRRLERPFDVIFIAPPQYKGLWRRALEMVDERPGVLLTESGVVVVQVDPKELEEVPLKNLAMYDERRYGNTVLRFYEVVGDIEHGDREDTEEGEEE